MKRWNILERLVKDNDFRRFMEVGVKEGRTTSWMLKNTACDVIACDPWCDQPQNAGKECGETYEGYRWENIKREFWAECRQWNSRLEFHRKRGEDVAPLIADESIDLVFIDAAHDYESVCRDIELFWPKVRAGGILSGHDWQKPFPTVIRAVSERFAEVNIEPDSVWWVRK